MNLNSIQWFDHSILFFVGMSFILNSLAAYLWKIKFYKKLGLKRYQSIQRIHLNETPRLGGFIFLISLMGYVIYSDLTESIYLLKLILLCLAPIVFIGIKEDLFHNVNPALRLLSLFFVGLLFIYKYTGPLPNLEDIPFFGKLLLIQGGVSSFYIICMLTVANGMNLIDGVNGLCGVVAVTSLLALLYLSYMTSDAAILISSSSLILIIIPFMILNYPFGKIFLGDLGSYSIGLIVSMLTIIFFGRHAEISPWGAVLILIYPAIEIIFSLLRRIAVRASPFKPDIEHLHIRFYSLFKLHLVKNQVANSFVMPSLIMIWLFPLVSIFLAYMKPALIKLCITGFIFLYFLIYLLVSKFYTKIKTFK